MNEYLINDGKGGKILHKVLSEEEREFAAPEQAAQAVPYPVEVWDGTLYGEFAERCTNGNHIAEELFIEGLKTVVGAVVGNQLQGDIKGVNPRQYTIAVAAPQSGKDTAFDECQEVMRRAEPEFDVEGKSPEGFLTHKVGFKNIGAKPVNLASEVAAIDAGLECTRLLNAPPEFGSLIDKSNIAGSGQALLELMLTAYDSTFPKFSTAKGRKEVPARLFLSVLTSIQPDRLSGMQVTSGLYSRFTWITVPKLDVVASLPMVEYGDFQKRLFAKLLPLEQNSIKITTSPEAVEVLNDWFKEVKARDFEDEQIRTRINIFVQRNALHLAWMRNETTITSDAMEKATRLCDWQLGVRAELFLRETSNPVAYLQQKILKALSRKGAMSRRQLYRTIHAYEVGTVIFEQALNGLVKATDVKALVSDRRNQLIYGIPKEQQQ